MHVTQLVRILKASDLHMSEFDKRVFVRDELVFRRVMFEGGEVGGVAETVRCDTGCRIGFQNRHGVDEGSHVATDVIPDFYQPLAKV